jgi:hypothetical protein
MIYFVMIQTPNPWHFAPHIVQSMGNDEYVFNSKVV